MLNDGKLPITINLDEILQSGALRFYAPDTRHDWLGFYVELVKKPLSFFAEDAFGIQFALINGVVAVFQTETAELEPIGMTPSEFYQAILNDPEGTLSWSLYKTAVQLLGKPSSEQHFAFKVELALGGQPVIENIEIINSFDHFKMMASIAKQIKDVPIGTILQLDSATKSSKIS